MVKAIGSFCVATALALDTMSYWKQISKIVRTRKSSQVSSSAYLYKIAKVAFSITGLVIFSNYVGLTMELFMLAIYATCLAIIARYKPRGWTLFGK